MAKSLVIVESPAKAKTISRYLGGGFEVKASVGHIKDLPKKKLGVDVRRDFKADYEIIAGKERVVQELRRAAARAEIVYIAADPDREGEAICQHIHEEISEENPHIFRVMFNEITREAIHQAFEHPGEINANLVRSQNTRRILDRLVGYKVSPLLWRKVRPGLSAGRVQTVALRLIVDREREIQKFVPEEYWVFTAHLRSGQPPVFRARAIKLDDKKFQVRSEAEAMALRRELEGAPFVVKSVRTTTRRQQPAPPFTTSKLQQEANRRFKLPASKTMQIAQRLYEGIELGPEGSAGLITYMRTDSTRTAPSALEAVRDFIGQAYGSEFLPGHARFFSKSDLAQDAHEAIRPTDVTRTPTQLKAFLKPDEFKLYTLIWQRFVASQMEAAEFRHTDIKIAAGRCLFQSTGDVPVFAGFLKVYQESVEDDPAGSGPDNAVLPPLQAEEVLKLVKLESDQQFTQPPPRYTEATLIKALEEKGIGRPSTYASIVTVIQNRQYVTKEEGRFRPSATGEIVIDLLVASFPELFDYDYTANMEKSLDLIEMGQRDWLEGLRLFYQDFSTTLRKAEAEMKNMRGEKVATEHRCPRCGAGMLLRWGRFGQFLSCERFPECRAAMPVPGGPPEGEPKAARPAPRELDEKCPECGQPLVERDGRFGRFVSCSGYPKCRYTKKDGGAETGLTCPLPGCGGDVRIRKAKRGRPFYGCSRYPACAFISNDKPVAKPCPVCGHPFLVEKSTKRNGDFLQCPAKGCGHKVLPGDGEAPPRP